VRLIKLKKPSLDKDWSLHFMDAGHYDQLLDESVRVLKPDGSPLLVLLKKAIDPQLAANAWAVLKTINSRTNNRGSSSGTKLKPRRRLDGTDSNTLIVPKGWDVMSAIIGSFERTIRAPYAHHCSWNSKNVESFNRIFPMLRQAGQLFREHVPERYAAQMEYVNKTHKDWIIPNTPYTTVTVNKNFRTAAHLDAGDLASGFSNMIVIKQGQWSGGHLVLPNWRIAAKLSNLDLILFDAHEFHGNTQLSKISKDAVRCSLVCYYRKKMVHCGSMKNELKFAKNRKIGSPLFPEAR
jgi:hypothetical protein